MCVIDLSAKFEQGMSSKLSVEDVQSWEAKHGRIPAGEKQGFCGRCAGLGCKAWRHSIGCKGACTHEHRDVFCFLGVCVESMAAK
eukprot:1156960-Pelagomonas_calceolata.AAC.7